MSQRAFAAAAGVGHTTLAAAESGRREPTCAVLEKVLRTAALDLVLTERSDAMPTAALRRHLRRSLTSRLLLALGAAPCPASPRRPAAWRDLEQLARTGQVLLETPLAERIWLPLGRAPSLPVTVHGQHRSHAPTAEVVAAISSAALPAGAVAVPLSGPLRIYVLPPAELLIRLATPLRAADRLLQAEAALDAAGRRRPAHRDPDDWAEQGRVLQDRRYGHGPLPQPHDGRAWRLDAPASLGQQMGRSGRLTA